MPIDPVFVTGTWDFKWPQGKKLRFAFQELPNQGGIEFAQSQIPASAGNSQAASTLDQLLGLWRAWGTQGSPGTLDQLETLIAQFERIARLWLNPDVGISFDFGSPGGRYRLPPPSIGTLGDIKIESAFDGNDQAVSYDVLVSFMPLPVLVMGLPSGRTPANADPETITGQVSVLGSYATRLPTGVPTTLVGPNIHFIDRSQGDALGEYFDSAAYEQIVVHEVGHILGLAHEHQNPLYREAFTQLSSQPLKLKDTDTLRTDVFAVLARKLSTEFGPGMASAAPVPANDLAQLASEVTRELANEWPHLPVATPGTVPVVPFSDWREWRGKLKGHYQSLESVMAHPGWINTLEGTLSLKAQPGQEAPALPTITAPTPQDLDAIREMYPVKRKSATKQAAS